MSGLVLCRNLKYDLRLSYSIMLILYYHWIIRIKRHCYICIYVVFVIFVFIFTTSSWIFQCRVVLRSHNLKLRLVMNVYAKIFMITNDTTICISLKKEVVRNKGEPILYCRFHAPTWQIWTNWIEKTNDRIYKKNTFNIIGHKYRELKCWLL